MPEAKTIPQTLEDNQLYRYYRNQWLLTGTDNFTTPPAQNQDMCEQLINILPPATNTLRRRFGYDAFVPALDNGGNVNSDQGSLVASIVDVAVGNSGVQGTTQTVTATPTNSSDLAVYASVSGNSPGAGWTQLFNGSNFDFYQVLSSSSAVTTNQGVNNNSGGWAAVLALIRTNGSTPVVSQVSASSTVNGNISTGSVSTTAGQCVFVGLSITDNTGVFTSPCTYSVTDTNSDTFVQLSSAINRDGGTNKGAQVILFGAFNVVGGSTNITATQNSGPTSGTLSMLFDVYQATNIAQVGGVTSEIKARHLYSYENHTLNERTIIATAGDGTGVNSLTNNVLYFGTGGSLNSIFTPSTNATSPRAVNSRDYEYFVDGVVGDQKAWNIVGGLSNWGIAAPTIAPSVAATSGTSATWSPNTEFTTMGILIDANGNTEQLVSVNATGTNASSTLGTSGVGQPAWNQTPGGTTTDGTITWTNHGPVGVWLPTHSYSNGTSGGTAGAPEMIFDPATNACYIVASSSGTSSSTRPPFTASVGWHYTESTGLKWFYVGAPALLNSWSPSTFYPFNTANDDAADRIVEPTTITQSYNALTNSFNQPVYIHRSNGGTSAASYASPDFQTGVGSAGTYCYDNQLMWLNLGSGSWPTSTAVTAWIPGSTNFTAIKDTNGNLQVCITGGTTAGAHPTWNSGYGVTTNETSGPVVWVCVGQSVSWAANTQWFLPANGFQAPQTLATYGGADIIDSNKNLETVINSGKSGGTVPVWAPVGSNTTDGTVTWFDVQPTAGGGTGVVTLVTPIGRRYYLVYLNSVKQNFSDVSPVSVATGPITNGEVALSNLQVSGDPQVDQKVILSTADGGDPTILYFVGQISNATTTFLDNVTEPNLLLSNIYQETSSTGNLIGVVGNQPPPNGSFPTLHKGRIFMILGTQLIFSKAIADVTTSTGIIAGRYEEDWPPEDSIDLSPGAENGKGLLSDGYALYIGTEKHVRRLLGSDPSDFQLPSVIFSETGLLSQDVWKIVFLEGTPVGTMWLTPDFRVIGSDFNSYNDVGTAIQSTLNTINPSAVQNCWAESITYGPYNFYVLAIPTGSHTDPDTICVYDLHLRKWYIWQFADTFISGIFYINIAGIPRWLVCDNNGIFRYINPLDYLDRQATPETPIGIASTIRTSWLDFADPSMRKTMNEIEVETSDVNMTVKIEGASTAADFSNPNIIVSGATLSSNIFGQLKVFLSGTPAIYRYYRFTFSSTSSLALSALADVILGYFSVEVLPLNRI